MGGLYAKVVRSILGSIEKASYSFVQWTADDLKELGTSLGMCGRLKELRLAGVGIDDDGAIACFTQLGSGALPQLDHLNLERNQISDVGCTALAEAVGRGALPLLQKGTLLSSVVLL